MNAYLLNLVIQLVAGAVGGNAAGGLLKQLDLGSLGNSIAGVIGGGVGGQILNVIVNGGAPMAASPSGALELSSLLTQIVGGGVGGGALMVIVGLVRQAMDNPGGRA
jgi:hypothetical protein